MTNGKTAKIEHAMVLAAGLGTRMRPITDTLPKPLVPVAGKPLLDHALDALLADGVRHVAINVHYLAKLIEDHVNRHSELDVSISDERTMLLDSGGGVKQAIRDFPSAPFFILNADTFWIDGNQPNLTSLREIWNPNVMDMLLLVAAKDQAVGFEGPGDFFMDADNRLRRRGEATSAPFIYAGAIVAKPELFAMVDENTFSLNRLFDEAIAKGRLAGCPMEGLWLHVGTPPAIAEAEAAIANHQRQAR